MIESDLNDIIQSKKRVGFHCIEGRVFRVDDLIGIDISKCL